MVGFWNGSASEIAGISTGKPRACQTPRLIPLGTLAEVAVARVDVAPGVDDRDHRLAGVVRPRIAHLRSARPVAERAQVVDAVPAVAAQFLGFLAGFGHFADSSFDGRATVLTGWARPRFGGPRVCAAAGRIGTRLVSEIR